MTLIIVAILCLLVVSGFSFDALADGRKKKIKALEADYQKVARERDVAYTQVHTAEKGLRKIANGIAGNPVLEAQVVLDDISNVKELN